MDMDYMDATLQGECIRYDCRWSTQILAIVSIASLALALQCDLRDPLGSEVGESSRVAISCKLLVSHATS